MSRAPRNSSVLLHVILTLMTGGFWLVVLLVRKLLFK